MASRIVRLAATPLDACQTRLTTQMKRVVISGDATQFYTELVDGPLTMAHRLHTCSRAAVRFRRDHTVLDVFGMGLRL